MDTNGIAVWFVPYEHFPDFSQVQKFDGGQRGSAGNEEMRRLRARPVLLSSVSKSRVEAAQGSMPSDGGGKVIHRYVLVVLRKLLASIGIEAMVPAYHQKTSARGC